MNQMTQPLPPAPAGEASSALPLEVVDRKPAPPAKSRRTLRWAVGITAVVLAGGGLLALVVHRGPAAPPTAAARMPEGTVVGAPAGVVLGLGKLLPRDRIVTIATPFGAGDARIAELRVHEGDRVVRETVLATLDSAPSLPVAEATVKARSAALAQAIVTVTVSQDDARAALNRAEASVTTMKRDLDRAVAMSGRGDISVQVLDQRRLASDQAVQDLARAQAALARYAATDILTQVDVAVALSSLASAGADRDRARVDLDRAIIRAPSDGTVLTL